MKKMISVVLLAFAALLVFSVAKTAYADVDESLDPGSAYATSAQTENLSSAEEGKDHVLYENHGYISLKPIDGTTAKLHFTVKTKEAGEYNFAIVYTAKEGTAARKMAIYANDPSTSVDLTLETAADWDTLLTHQVTIYLRKGTNNVVLTTSSDYDNTTVKTPNIYAISYARKTPLATPTSAFTPTPTLEPTATPTPTQAPTPTVEPTAVPTVVPTDAPTVVPTEPAATITPVVEASADSSSGISLLPTILISICSLAGVLLLVAIILLARYRKNKSDVL